MFLCFDYGLSMDRQWDFSRLVVGRAGSSQWTRSTCLRFHADLRFARQSTVGFRIPAIFVKGQVRAVLNDLVQSVLSLEC